MSYFKHSLADVEDGVVVGEGTKIWRWTHVQSGSTIGERCVLGQNVHVGSGVKIGNWCKIQNNVSLYTGVELKDSVFCGPSMVFTNVLNPRAHVERKDQFIHTLIRHGATIGANATIVGNITIGRYAFIAAGAVVTKDVRDYAVVIGVPGRQRGWACECGERITKHTKAPEKRYYSCDSCDKRYAHERFDFFLAEEEESN